VETTATSVTVAACWTYTWLGVLRPFVHPLRTPAGHVLSRNAPQDHPWHHGLWFTIKFVDGANYWEEYGDFGLLVHRGPPTVEVAADGSVALAGTLDWVQPHGAGVAVVEERRLTHVPIGDDAYAIDLDTRLVADHDVTYDRTPFTTWGGYGGLTIRGPADWIDTQITLDDGSVHERVLGTPSRWFDLSGTVTAGGADAPAGVALFDHPGNRRHPSPVYASTRADTYGDEGWSNFANLAFLWDAPLEVAAGEALHLRHRTVVHDGPWDAARLDQAWRSWATT
jgi:hypothetical protein